MRPVAVLQAQSILYIIASVRSLRNESFCDPVSHGPSVHSRLSLRHPSFPIPLLYGQVRQEDVAFGQTYTTVNLPQLPGPYPAPHNLGRDVAFLSKFVCCHYGFQSNSTANIWIIFENGNFFANKFIFPFSILSNFSHFLSIRYKSCNTLKIANSLRKLHFLRFLSDFGSKGRMDRFSSYQKSTKNLPPK